MADNNDNDIENLKKRIKALEDKPNIQQNALLEGQIKSLEKEIDNQQKELQRDLALRSETTKELFDEKYKSIENRITIYISSLGLIFTIVIGLLTFLGKSTIVNWAEDKAKDIIKTKTEEKIKESVTTDYIDEIVKDNITPELISGIVITNSKEAIEDAINKTVSELNKKVKDIEEKTKDRLLEIENLKNEYVALLANLKEKPIDIGKPVTQETIEKLEKFDETVAQVKTEDKFSSYDWKYRGISEFNKKEYANAIESFTKALEKSPKSSDTYSWRAYVYIYLEQYERAIEDLNKAIELDPEFAIAYNNRGDAYNGLKQYKRAIEDLNKAIELAPESAIPYTNRGNAYNGLKQYEKAIEDLNKAIELDPEFAMAYNNRGDAYNGLKQYEKANEDLNKAIELDQENKYAYNNRGNAYYFLKQYGKAIENYNKAIELDPEAGPVYIHLSEVIIVEKGDYESALDVIKKAMSLPLEIKNKALALYLKCITEKLLDIDISVSEKEFNEIIKSDFTKSWSLDNLESWLEDANIDDDTKRYIKEKSELLKEHLE